MKKILGFALFALVLSFVLPVAGYAQTLTKEQIKSMMLEYCDKERVTDDVVNQFYEYCRQSVDNEDTFINMLPSLNSYLEQQEKDQKELQKQIQEQNAKAAEQAALEAEKNRYLSARSSAHYRHPDYKATANAICDAFFKHYETEGFAAKPKGLLNKVFSAVDKFTDAMENDFKKSKYDDKKLECMEKHVDDYVQMLYDGIAVEEFTNYLKDIKKENGRTFYQFIYRHLNPVCQKTKKKNKDRSPIYAEVADSIESMYEKYANYVKRSYFVRSRDNEVRFNVRYNTLVFENGKFVSFKGSEGLYFKHEGLWGDTQIAGFLPSDLSKIAKEDKLKKYLDRTYSLNAEDLAHPYLCAEGSPFKIEGFSLEELIGKTDDLSWLITYYDLDFEPKGDQETLKDRFKNCYLVTQAGNRYPIAKSNNESYYRLKAYVNASWDYDEKRRADLKKADQERDKKQQNERIAKCKQNNYRGMSLGDLDWLVDHKYIISVSNARVVGTGGQGGWVTIKNKWGKSRRLFMNGFGFITDQK